ncbi:MAG: hypothetical protein ACI35S_06645 [Anaeroplasma sp.]
MNSLFAPLKKQDKFIVLLIFIPLVAIFAKYYQFNYLSDMAFSTSNRILDMVLRHDFSSNDSFSFAARFYSYINFFNLDTVLKWNIYLAIIFNPILIILFMCIKRINWIDMILIIATSFILNLFVFNFAKDIVQFIFYLFIVIFYKSKLKYSFKLIFILLLFLFEGLFFRQYYAFIGLLFVVAYLLNYFFEKNNYKRYHLFPALFILSFIIIMFILMKFFPNYYREFIDARTNFSNDMKEANTLIISIFDFDTFPHFLANYFINALRLLFPFELLTKGFNITYIVFFFYQIFITISFIKIVLSKDVNSVFKCILIAYFIVSFGFEPDFGSFVRHESTIFNIVLISYKELDLNKQFSVMIEQSERGYINGTC